MLESELIITVTNVGCLHLWVFVFRCLLVLFSARRFQTFGERTRNLLFLNNTNLSFFAHMKGFLRPSLRPNVSKTPNV